MHEPMFEEVENYMETSFHKWPRIAKLMKKKHAKKIHRGTNFERLGKLYANRKGLKRVKIGPKRYIVKYMPAGERTARTRIGKQLGMHPYLRK